MDREYSPVTMRSKYPDRFQIRHTEPSYVDPTTFDPKLLPRKLESIETPVEESSPTPTPTTVQEETIPEEPEDELKGKTITIKEGATGYSYKNLFGPYLKDATSINLLDPYIRLEFQIHNLIAFIGILDTVDGPVKLHLVTSASDNEQEVINSAKFEEIAENSAQHGIEFTFEFSSTLHKRGLEMDNGWKISIDRGLDFYQKPASRYELSEVDQTKRKCRETEIIFMKE
jgi:ATP-dependent Lon protease